MSTWQARHDLINAIFDSWRSPETRRGDKSGRVYLVECHQMPGAYIEALIRAALVRGIERGRVTDSRWDDEPWIEDEVTKARAVHPRYDWPVEAP